jgi:hypothetical protein
MGGRVWGSWGCSRSGLVGQCFVGIGSIIIMSRPVMVWLVRLLCLLL